MTKSRWIGLGIGIVLILAAFGVVAWQSLALPSSTSVAAAQAAATAAPTPTPSTVGPKQPSTSPNVTNASIGDAFWSALAAKLGVSVDTLKADAVQVRKDMLDQAVKDGRITQAQADQLKQELDANKLIAPIYIGRGELPPGGPGFRGPGNGPQRVPGLRGRGFGFGFGFGTTELEAVAKAVNLSPADLLTQLRGGKTLADIAKAQNVDQATVKQAIIDARKAEIDREVTDGLITQAQADGLKSRLTPDNIDLTRMPFFGYH